MEANPQRIEWPQLGPRKTTAHEGISQVRVIQTKSVEAVGIEQVATHPTSRIDGGLWRTNGVGRPDRSPEERGLKDDLGTNDPKLLTRDELLARISTASERGLIDAGYALTLTELIEALREGALRVV
jgi:hypothetical protein